MVYQILASICQHPIRLSDTPTRSGSLLDPDVYYCNHCEASRSLRQERDYAERNYRSRQAVGVQSRGNREAYLESRHTYDRSRLAYVEDVQRQQDRDDYERRAQGRPTLYEESRRFAGLDSPRRGEIRRERPGEIYRTRFAEPESHRRESEYRSQRSYRRASRDYQSGAHSDRGGHGYFNTSDPYASSSDGDSDADLDALSNDELNERMRRLQEVQARFRR